MTDGGAFSKTWAALLLALAAVLACAPAQAKQKKPAAPALQYRAKLIGHYFAEYRVPDFERIIRGINLTKDTLSGLGRAAFPAELRTGTEPATVRVFLEATLAEGDSLEKCSISSANRWTAAGGAKIEVTPALIVKICTLVSQHLKFRHGLFDDGRSIRGPLQITLDFSRWTGPTVPNFLPPSVSVVPPPIWAPNTLPSPLLTFTEPEWEKFLPPLTSLPKSLSVGVEVRVAPDGSLASCMASGYTNLREFDAGVCNALRRQARTGPIAEGHWRYPILVRWDGVSVKMVAPRQSRPPALAGEPRIPADVAAPQSLPANPVVHASVLVGKDGKTRRCRIRDGAMDDRLDMLTCAMLLRPGFFKPGVDIFGDPSPWQMRTEIDWRKGGIELKPLY